MTDEYDYRGQVTSDIRDYFEENDIHLKDYDSREELFDKVRDSLWDNDSVTGNASGSYFCNSYLAEEALCHNWDLIADALNEFGDAERVLDMGPEATDVTIRCYLLDECLNDVIDELESEEEYNDPFAEDEDEEEEDEQEEE